MADINDESKKEKARNVAKEKMKEGIPGLLEKSDLVSIGDSVYKSTGVKFTINSLYQIKKEAVTEHDEDFKKKIEKLEKDSREKTDKLRADKETLNNSLREREDEIIRSKQSIGVLYDQNDHLHADIAQVSGKHGEILKQTVDEHETKEEECLKKLGDLEKSRTQNDNEIKNLKEELKGKGSQVESFKEAAEKSKKTAKRNGDLAFYSLTGLVWFVSYALIYLVFGFPTLGNVDPVGLIWLMPVLIIGGSFYILIKYYFSNNPIGIVLPLIIITAAFYANIKLSDVPLNHSTQRLIFWIAPAYLLWIYVEASTILRYKFLESIALWYHALVKRFHRSVG